ncbi:DEAD/DEAH box helicase family protein [Aeromicrobium halocynthiae]|uniref:DEAD/DEAH box helicase family protein n=1 Tax=Aeromicrobium halocynthiae TaxID=560557 RepID=A0ABN2VU00_9ACTN
MGASALANPILNGPYDIPSRHFAMGPQGPTGDIVDGRRPSESFIPVAQAVKNADGSSQGMLEFEGTVERRELNSFINSVRREVDLWRAQNYPRATAVSRKLMLHWCDEHRENRVLFCQREAVETAIYLHEVAGREDFREFRTTLEAHNVQYNDGLPRIALKMATGSGKTVVMAMLVAWQTLNKVATPRDARFVKRFLVVAPGVTIRDRLRVLQPGSPGNYYDLRDLVPADLAQGLGQARLAIVNYHAFVKRETKEFAGVAKTTKAILKGHREGNPFEETDEAMVHRVLRDLGPAASGRSGEIMVLNDEAHHCYRDRPVGASERKSLKLTAEEKADAKQANEDARVWFKGLQAVAKHVGIKAVWDLSATPYYLKGSGYHEGFIFPWTVCDFSLMDAIESGIVKVPRLPVDDDAAGDEVAYRDLWEDVGPELGKRKLKDVAITDWVMPTRLEGALRSLYANYGAAWRQWEETLRSAGEPPPVFIVVCPNTAASKLVHEWIAGFEVGRDGGYVEHTDGHLPLFSNGQDGKAVDRPRTILVDSAQLESGEPLKGEFKSAVAGEIETFKSEYRRRNPGADTDKITDAELLREVLNTVGKKGRLGEQVRCVVSVAMLTEGWDANTVSHILGIRAFRSQLLCEQVVGRGLRRRSYALGEDGLFSPEYANVYGIPFAFIPSEHETGSIEPPPPAQEVVSLAGREQYRIEFPILDGYRTEVPDAPIEFDPTDETRLVVGRDSVPRWTRLAGIAGENVEARIATADAREQRIGFEIASRLLRVHFTSDQGEQPWLFPRLLDVTRRWLRECVDMEDGYDLTRLLLAEAQSEAAEKIHRAIVQLDSNRRPRVRAMLRRGGHVGATDGVDFLTRKAVVDTTKSEVSHVVLDGKDGNTWEQLLAAECEISPDVAAYVKNDHLGFAIPYVHRGHSHSYLPDFLIRLRRRDDDVQRYLIVEVSGGQKSPGPTVEKAQTALTKWCPAVNNDGRFGRWGYVEITTMIDVRRRLQDAIDSLYADGPVIGDDDVQDFGQTGVNEVLGAGS